MKPEARYALIVGSVENDILHWVPVTLAWLQVVWSDRTKAAVQAAKSEGRSLWRVSSTVFGHVASDQLLQPLPPFLDLPSASQYPAIKAGAYVEQELSIIALKGHSEASV